MSLLHIFCLVLYVDPLKEDEVQILPIMASVNRFGGDLATSSKALVINLLELSCTFSIIILPKSNPKSEFPKLDVKARKRLQKEKKKIIP